MDLTDTPDIINDLVERSFGFGSSNIVYCFFDGEK